MNLDPIYTNPANSAQNYFNQIPGTISPYYQPYINAGQQSLNTLMGQYNNLLTNPGSVIAMAGSGYQQSPGYQYNYNQAVQGADEAAAAGGMLGTPSNQQTAAAAGGNVANQDYQNYLNQSIGLYKTGLNGEEGINQMGYNASNELAQSLAAALMNQGSMAYAGQGNQNQANADFLGSMISGVTSFL